MENSGVARLLLDLFTDELIAKGLTLNICARIEELTGTRPLVEPDVLGNTSAYMAIDRDDVLSLGCELYLVRGNAREGRFGLHDQPKFWVKNAIALSDGRRVMLKLVFHEKFSVRIGNMSFRCRRSEQKEARVLDFVRGDPCFMQGKSVRDERSNLVRVLEFIPGDDLLTHVVMQEKPHQKYFNEDFPDLLANTIAALQGIMRLHQAGLSHGDIRNDHIIIDRGSGCFRWIDFDLEQDFTDFDVWSAGNILQVVAGQGLVTTQRIKQEFPGSLARFNSSDASVFFPHRMMNLRKIFPYLPEKLNAVLMRFSAGTQAYYERIDQIIVDLCEVAEAQGWTCSQPS